MKSSTPKIDAYLEYCFHHIPDSVLTPAIEEIREYIQTQAKAETNETLIELIDRMVQDTFPDLRNDYYDEINSIKRKLGAK